MKACSFGIMKLGTHKTNTLATGKKIDFHCVVFFLSYVVGSELIKSYLSEHDSKAVHESDVTSIEFLFNGAVLMSGSKDSTLKAWNRFRSLLFFFVFVFCSIANVLSKSILLLSVFFLSD